MSKTTPIPAYGVPAMVVKISGWPSVLWTSPHWPPTTWTSGPGICFPLYNAVAQNKGGAPAGIAATPFGTLPLAVGPTAQSKLIATLPQVIGQHTHYP